MTTRERFGSTRGYKMSSRKESEVKARVELAGSQPDHADLSFVHGLDDWIRWRAAKLQVVRQQIVAKTHPVHNPGLTSRARAASHG